MLYWTVIVIAEPDGVNIIPCKQGPDCWLNIRMLSYQCRKSYFGDLYKEILWLSYIHNGNSYTDKTASLYWIGTLMIFPGLSCPSPQNLSQAPVPVTLFRLNLKFNKKLKCSSLKCAQLITTKFCTHHDSYTVVMCAKFCCVRSSTF